jgi:hypothetical protein
MTGEGPFGSVEMGGMFTVLKVRRDQKPGDYGNPGWFMHPPGTIAYEFQGKLPEARRASGSGTGSMPPKVSPRKDIEVQIRKPRSGHSGH